MNYEQKYNASLEQAKKELATCGSMDCDAARLIFRLFPQLRENEDERIMSDIILAINEVWMKNDADRMIAYLEKLKEPLTPEEKMNHPLFLEGFDVGRQVGEVVAKPAEWSENDKRILDEAIGMIEAKGCWVRSDDAVEQVSDFLKSLPERFNLQPKQEWSEEDEENLGKLHRLLLICRGEKKFIQEADYNKMDNFLKSLRPQPKQEWGKEDEIGLNDAIKYVQNYGETSSDEYARLRTKEIVEWLKSLHQRFSLSSWGEEIRDAFFGVERNWKPSEDDLDAFKELIDDANKRGWVTPGASRLYEQLKAL